MFISRPVVGSDKLDTTGVIIGLPDLELLITEALEEYAALAVDGSKL